MGEAIEKQTIEGGFGGAKVKFEILEPSPWARGFVPQLASYHIQAVFTLISTPKNHAPEDVRLLPLDQFHAFDSFTHTDWGNPQLVEITRRASGWPCVAAIHSADGFFRACMRRSDSDGWFWALEWNKSLRVLGGINHAGETNPLFENLPALAWKPMPDRSGFFREELKEPNPGDILSRPDRSLWPLSGRETLHSGCEGNCRPPPAPPRGDGDTGLVSCGS